MVIRALQRGDDRSGFRSGNSDLDRYFHKFAGQNQFRHHIGTTYIAMEGARILGFVTISAGELATVEFPASEAKRLLRYPVPVLRIARLAVDASEHGKGIGAQLLRFALVQACEMEEKNGCVGVVVDAKPESAAFYERFGFTSVELAEGRWGAAAEAVNMFLAMKVILKARN